MRPILFFAFSLMLILSSCKKQINELPDATQNGSNTFGCLLNGKAWIPTGRGPASGVYPTSGGFFKNVDNSWNIYVSAFNENNEIHIYLKQVSSKGYYALNKNTAVRPGPIFPESYGEYYQTYSFGNNDYYSTDSLHIGFVDITRADTLTGIVSGTFQMQLYQQSTGKTLNITNGRFDYKTHI